MAYLAGLGACVQNLDLKKKRTAAPIAKPHKISNVNPPKSPKMTLLKILGLNGG
jgi:hypothetical protein